MKDIKKRIDVVSSSPDPDDGPSLAAEVEEHRTMEELDELITRDD